MAPNIYIIAICRLVIGIVVGINSTLVPVYVREMSPVSVSGFTGSMVQAFINIGIMTSAAFSFGTDNNASM